MEKIRVAMIGGGIGSLIGSTHRNAMRLSGKYKLVAACFSPTPEKNKQTADNIAENPRLYHDWQEMIMQEAARKDGAQLVLVATPDHLHFDNCYLALKNYMHVIGDKPLCENEDQAKILFDLALQNKKRLEVTYTTAGDPAYRAMKQYVQQPEFGKIYQVNGLFMANWCINLPEFNPDHPMHKYSWRLQAQKGFGALGTIGTHIFEYCRQLFGKEAPLSIMGSLQKTYDERELNDGGMAIINYPNQSLINIRYSLSLTSKDHHQISVNSQYQSILYNVNESYFWAVNEKGDMQKIEAQTIPDFENYANLCEKSEGWDQDNFKNYWRFKNLYDDFAQNISTSATYTKSDMEHHSGICGAKMISKILLSDKEKRQIDW